MGGSQAIVNGEDQIISGAIGRTSGLFDEIDEQITIKGLSWTRLAKMLAVSRQALIWQMKQERVPFSQLARVCGPLGIDPFSLFETIEPTDNAELL